MPKKKPEEIQLPWETDAFKKAWEDWIEYRRQRKIAKYTEIGLPRTLTRLKNDSGDDELVAIEMINQSIELNYQGLFPLKNQHNGSGQGNTANGKSTKPGTSEARIDRAKNW